MTDTRATTAFLRPLDVGFMPLLDAAPLLAASHLGLDRRHGLQLRLHRQPSWATLRDRLLTGALDAAQAMSAMVLGVQAGIGGPQADLAILMVLNHNGQAIVLAPEPARRLREGASLREALEVPRQRPRLAHTFPTGTHAMWLYYWLAAQDVDPLHEIEAVTLPPPQMPGALAGGELLGYSVGEPWAAQAEVQGIGARVIRSGELWPGHPEKVLACRRAFAALEPDTVTALTAAVLEACRWLDESADHRARAAHWLAADGAIDLPVEVLVECLLLPEGDQRTTRLRFHGDGEVNFPWLSDGRWFLHQFRRWGWLSPDAMGDDARLAELHRLDSYRLAALQAGVPLPRGDTRRSVLFDGMRWE